MHRESNSIVKKKMIFPKSCLLIALIALGSFCELVELKKAPKKGNAHGVVSGGQKSKSKKASVKQVAAPEAAQEPIKQVAKIIDSEVVESTATIETVETVAKAVDEQQEEPTPTDVTITNTATVLGYDGIIDLVTVVMTNGNGVTSTVSYSVTKYKAYRTLPAVTVPMMETETVTVTSTATVTE